MRTLPFRMVRGTAAFLVAAALCTPAFGALYNGKLRIDRPGRGQIDLNSGSAAFAVRQWEFLVAPDSNGIDPATEPVAVGVADEKFLIPAGGLKVSRNGKRFSYRASTDHGIVALKLVLGSDGNYKVKLLKVAGVDLSTLVISDPPICFGVALIIGDDDGFSGVWFDRPKPFPSKLLTLTGLCDATSDWPWL